MALSHITPASVHLFERGGFFVLLDIPSGSIFLLERPVYDYLGAALEEPTATSDRLSKLTGIDGAMIAEIERELEQPIASNCLFTTPQVPAEDASGLLLKSICLNVAHECNFSCAYCFAHGGDYHGEATLMSDRVAQAAIDFLALSSDGHHNVEVDFFGGEPLMDWDVVVHTMAYARSRYPAKTWRFTLTTNGSLLRRDMFPVFEQYDVSVVLSLDGGRQANDVNRKFKNGQGTFDTIVQRIQEFTEMRKAEGGYFVRGTYSKNTLQFAQSVKDLHDLGFRYISMEPVVLSADSALALHESDLPAIRAQYEELITYFLQQMQGGEGFDFFHFKLDLEAGPCLDKRIYGCGAGVEYMAVAPNGDLFPCHQFDGTAEYRLGNVLEDPVLQRPDLVRQLAHANFLFAKQGCADCWARFYCSGGCLANNYSTNYDVLKPYAMGCAVQKERIEAALAVKAAEKERGGGLSSH